MTGRPYDVAVATYARGMWFLILLVIAVVGVVAWKLRVPLLARLLGQSESRVDRQLNRRRD